MKMFIDRYRIYLINFNKDIDNKYGYCLISG